MQLSLVAFQRAQQISVEKQKTVVEGVKIAADEEEHVSCVDFLPLASRPALTLTSFVGPNLNPVHHRSNDKRSYFNSRFRE